MSCCYCNHIYDLEYHIPIKLLCKHVLCHGCFKKRNSCCGRKIDFCYTYDYKSISPENIFICRRIGSNSILQYALLSRVNETINPKVEFLAIFDPFHFSILHMIHLTIIYPTIDNMQRLYNFIYDYIDDPNIILHALVILSRVDRKIIDLFEFNNAILFIFYHYADNDYFNAIFSDIFTILSKSYKVEELRPLLPILEELMKKDRLILERVLITFENFELQACSIELLIPYIITFLKENMKCITWSIRLCMILMGLVDKVNFIKQLPETLCLDLLVTHDYRETICIFVCIMIKVYETKIFEASAMVNEMIKRYQSNPRVYYFIQSAFQCLNKSI